MNNKKKVSYLQLLTCVLYTSALLVSNILTSKQCLFPFGIVVDGAIFIFPITYILSDVFSEVYGYKWSRITNYIGFAMQALMSVIFMLVERWSYPDYYTNQEAFSAILGNTPRIAIASLVAFVLGDLVNDKIFDTMKTKHKDSMKGFGLRAIVSSVFGNTFDSTAFYIIAFIGIFPVNTILSLILGNAILKTSYEIICLPVTTLVTKKVLKYERDAENSTDV